jgi:hypothetical protein
MQGYAVCEQNNMVKIVHGTNNVDHLSWKRQQLYDHMTLQYQTQTWDFVMVLLCSS